MFQNRPGFNYHDIVRGDATSMYYEGMPGPTAGGKPWSPPMPFPVFNEDPFALMQAVADFHGDDRYLVLGFSDVRLSEPVNGDKTWYVTVYAQVRTDDADAGEAAGEDHEAAGDGGTGDEAGSGDRGGEDLRAAAAA